jgi:hypothetical protein
MEENRKTDIDFIRAKLSILDRERDELSSLLGRQGSEWHGTDTGYAMQKFLGYTGSLYGSPPGSSFGSPIPCASNIVTDGEVESAECGKSHEDRVLHEGEFGDNTRDQCVLRPREDFTVGWLCALSPDVFIPVMRSLGVRHLQLPFEDENMYVYGSINKYNIVIACMPPDKANIVSATRLAESLSQSFPNI